LIIAACGVVFALAANALSPLGLKLSRNYFPTGVMTGGGPATSTGSVTGVTAVVPSTAITNPPGSDSPAAASSDAIALRLRQRGLQLVGSNEVINLFRDPRHEQGLVVFVDARNDQHYASGHIPGAWPFDHYRAENYLPTLLPICLSAMQVVVYCNGGECEDSEFAAILLREAGVAAANLLVYAGGIVEWKAHGWPIETGPRGGGAQP
jgi:rhodanese-related sulfurtransferase